MIRRPFSAVFDSITHMSRTPANYWAEFFIDIPLGVVLIFKGGTLSHGIHPAAGFLTILIGLFLFSFLEYNAHRRLFHGSSVRLLALGHRRHHEDPLGYDALPFFVPALVLLPLTGVFVLLMPKSYAFLLSGAIALGYVTYGLSHFAIHHTRFRQPLIKRWAANHHIHHYHPDSNFGVTTPLWDMVFGTRYVSNYKRI